MLITPFFQKIKSKQISIFFTIFLLFSSFKVFSAEEDAVDSPKYIVGISHTHRFVWFRVAKVASTTIKDIFSKQQIKMPIMSSSYKFNPKRYKNYFKFAFVRNPWARVVSCYCQKVENKNPRWAFYYRECFDKGFDYFVDFIDRQDLTSADRHIRLQTALIPVDKVDFIGHLENFDADLKYVLNTIHVFPLRIHKKNPSNHLHYSRYYNEKTQEIIARKYQSDIETFGYHFESR